MSENTEVKKLKQGWTSHLYTLKKISRLKKFPDG